MNSNRVHYAGAGLEKRLNRISQICNILVGVRLQDLPIYGAQAAVVLQMQSFPIPGCRCGAGFRLTIGLPLPRRGPRLAGVRMMVIYSLPLGLMTAGSLIDLIGFAATGTLYAVAGLALMLLIGLHWRTNLWHVHAPANAK